MQEEWLDLEAEQAGSRLQWLPSKHAAPAAGHLGAAASAPVGSAHALLCWFCSHMMTGVQLPIAWGSIAGALAWTPNTATRPTWQHWRRRDLLHIHGVLTAAFYPAAHLCLGTPTAMQASEVFAAPHCFAAHGKPTHIRQAHQTSQAGSEQRLWVAGEL